MTDLLLAIAHHLLVFAIAGAIAAEAVLVQPGVTAAQIRTIGRLDAAYGVAAILILIVGFGRVFYGLRGPEFFLENPWFWAKLWAFLVVGLLSAPPTIRYIAWRRRLKTDGQPMPDNKEVLWVRRLLFAEAAVFALIPILAAAMVRVPSL
jgi:putative membrane protein